jgi:hypothetical protein
MQETARMIATRLPAGTGFILLAFDLDTPHGRTEYIANGRREDCIKALKEFIAKTEGQWMKHAPDRPQLAPGTKFNIPFELVRPLDGLESFHGIEINNLKGNWWIARPAGRDEPMLLIATDQLKNEQFCDPQT